MTATAVDAAVAALLAINSDDKPFELTAERSPAGAVVTGRWKVWDVKWQTLLGRGKARRDYALTVTLDAATGTYAFTETDDTDESEVAAGPAGVQGRREKTWFAGKTSGTRSRRIVLGTTVNSEDRQGTTEGPLWSGSFRAADLKEPVFGTLRELGWKPRRDGRWARFWER